MEGSEHPTAESARDRIADIGRLLDAAHLPIIASFQHFLRSLEGQDFGFEVNREITGLIQDTLGRLGMAVRCTNADCGKPAKLRCFKPGNRPSGVFQFQHTSGGRANNHGGSKTFPALTIVPSAPDMRRKRRKETDVEE